ncbi:TIGR03936 family radical SAM-associated protein [Propionicicella superfundia]|uniref:TIGR03936 family radical SAM-associated protein n=1 Tax=Propionicicella superfundia TaxID=348582 RepID=UPI0003FFC9B4|nr:TIGR03936 family radical SAM-associated protein [Propionicicella superfundia]
MARQQPAQQAPPVQRLRIRYAKRGRLRFASHRDFARAFERALRRAGVPMAYSSGFSPHPRISYANAAPTGAASEAEYLEIALVRECDPAAVRDALDASLPAGLDVLDAVPARAGALADRLTGSRWRIEVSGVDEETLRDAVTAFLAADEVAVERMMKSGLRRFDARGPVVALEVRDGVLDLLVEHGTPLVRPDDVVQALGRVRPGVPEGLSARATRLRQGTLRDGELADPLA